MLISENSIVLWVLFSFRLFLPSYSISKKPVTYQVYSFTDGPLSHGESPVWDHENQTLYWVDVLNGNVYGLDYRTGRLDVKHIECKEINVVVPVASSSYLLVGADSSLFLIDWNELNPRIIRIATFDRFAHAHVINEGKADAKGRFWGGTKGFQRGDVVMPHKGSFYRVQAPDLRPVVMLAPVSISNGLTWSLNNSVLYYIDSADRQIDAFDYNLETGMIKNRRIIIDLAKDDSFKGAIPDGMTTDRDDKLWVALMFGGKILRIDPDKRRIMEVYRLPTPKVTSLTWAGPKLEDLIVTTSRRNSGARSIAEYPLSGSIFVLRNLGTGGVPSHKFVINKSIVKA